MEETPEDIYIDREADYEAMRTAFELGGHTVHHVPDGEYPSGAAFISCSDDSMTMTVGDWVTDLPNGHTEGAAYYAAGWLHGFDCGADSA